MLDTSIKYMLETRRFVGPNIYVRESWSMPSCQNGATPASYFIFIIILLILLLLLLFFYHFFML